jgi:hypothetical protein
MLDLSLAYTYAPVCVCLFKISFMCSMLYAFQVSGVPSFNAHVILGCLLFIDRTYYTEKIFNTNLFSAFVLFSVILNRERSVHNQHSGAKWAITLVLNILWVLVGIGALLKLERRMSFLRYIRYDPLIVSCYFLAVHSFIDWKDENELQTVMRISNFFLVSVAWIYLFNSRFMKPTCTMPPSASFSSDTFCSQNTMHLSSVLLSLASSFTSCDEGERRTSYCVQGVV